MLGSGIAVGLFGLFLVLYEGDGGEDTWVSVGDRRVDADLFGAVALTLSVIAISFSILTLKRDRRRAGRS